MPSPSSSDVDSKQSTDPPMEAEPIKPAPWTDASTSNDALTPPRPWKGKGKVPDAGDDDPTLSDTEVSDTSVGGAYPPNEDDEAETRRIQENLRRWEITERQRRKAARESVQSTTTSSLMSDVTRRASLLWANRKPKHNSDAHEGLGKHAALNSRESFELPLEDIATAASPAPSPTPTAATSPFSDAQAQNPFLASSEHLSPSGQVDQIDSTTVMIPSDSADLQSAPSKPPPPQPLNLPPPRTPPPRIDSPPPPIPPLIARHDKMESKMQETRWWHDVLCGCSEGPDRGGDYQAGRTNPFE